MLSFIYAVSHTFTDCSNYTTIYYARVQCLLAGVQPSVFLQYYARVQHLLAGVQPSVCGGLACWLGCSLNSVCGGLLAGVQPS